MTDFNPFDPPQAAEAAAQDAATRARQAQNQALVDALGHPAGRAWLEALLTREYGRPSYVPGDTHDTTAWREGRKAVLREIAEQLHRALTPGTGA